MAKPTTRAPQSPRGTALTLVDTVETWSPERWYPLSSYSVPGKAAGAFYKETLGWASDNSGLYFLRAKRASDFEAFTGVPLKRRLFYVGRAGQISRRLNRHLQVVNHNSASLVYKITAKSLDRNHMTRNDNMSDVEGFLPAFQATQRYLRDHCEMTYFLCDNDHRQAILEILFSLRFRTEFNDWRTH